jgi:hypothetical protein
LKVTRSVKVSALLLIVVTISVLQVVIFLMQPNTSNLVYAAQSGGAHENQVTTITAGSSSVVVSISNRTMTLISTFPTTVATTVSMTFATTVTPQSPPGYDYTPAGIGIVTAAAIIALLIMFLKRKR